jgi:hypothetical protein
MVGSCDVVTDWGEGSLLTRTQEGERAGSQSKKERRKTARPTG